MRGISKDRLIDIFACYSLEAAERIILQECRELQEPWMTLDEFLKSGFVGLCFVLIDGVVEEAKFYGHKFAITQPYGTIKSVDKYQATKVMPIHKPEPPK